MSIRQIQTKNLLDLISESYFIGGINPQLDDILKYVSYFFSQNPPGQPISYSKDAFDGSIANEQAVNDLMAKAIFNVDTLYESLLQNVDELLLLNTILRTHLERLKTKRSILESKIDDYLLGVYNSDGYFYSISDNYTDSSLVDLNLTSAFIDVEAGTVGLPVIAGESVKVEVNRIADPTIQVYASDNSKLTYEIKSPFSNATDGLTNTAWFFQVKTTSPQSVVAIVNLELASALGSTQVTRVDLTPFGVTPVRVGINATFNDDIYSGNKSVFSNTVQTSTDKMSFIGEQINSNIGSLEFILTKSQPDWTVNEDSSVVYVYNFGFKEVSLSENVYDLTAKVVSEPLALPAEFGAGKVIDAVSLVVKDDVPTNTAVKYYVAADVPGASAIGDFNWREITPIGTTTSQSEGQVVSFDGAQKVSKMIRFDREMGSDLQLILPDTTNEDLSKRNPSSVIVPGATVYRIAEFKEDLLTNSITIEEGINTTRIYHTDLDTNAVSNGFDFWQGVLSGTSYLTAYGQIDSGHDSLYGGDVGESGRSVYMETFLYADSDTPTVLKQCAKQDPNAALWDVRVFLNGREIANMPVGINKLTVPWKFVKGKNHIAILANIPDPTLAYPTPYLGSVNLMTESKLNDFGTVKLDDWNYVDFYKFENNLTNNQNSFTIYNSEIITRKKPTDNLRLSFARPTLTGPEAIRIRADLSRSSSYSKATPLIDSYRLRFSYK